MEPWFIVLPEPSDAGAYRSLESANVFSQRNAGVAGHPAIRGRSGQKGGAMTPKLLTVFGASVVAAAIIVTAPGSTWAQDACRQGFVWREAFPGDHVCVTPETRAEAAQDNSQASARREPAGGAYGPNTCLSGYVWREARQGDLVCVTPKTRAQAASDNAQASARRAVSAPPAAPAPASGYKVSDWSPWSVAEGVKYLYRWGLNPPEAR